MYARRRVCGGSRTERVEGILMNGKGERRRRKGEKKGKKLEGEAGLGRK